MMIHSRTPSIPESSQRRILLFGPNGQVGWELRRSLATLGQVISVGRSATLGNRFIADLTHPDSIRKVIREVKPALIINAAAYTAVDKAEEQSELAMVINGDAVGVMAEEAKKANCGIVHYSTDYVFDGGGETAWTEDDAPAPINTYGRTKLAGEEAIRATGAGHLILRVSWVHGVYGANFVKTMLRLAAQRSELSIVADQVGAPTSARVIADATAQIVAQLDHNTAGDLKERGGTYHFTCQGETNWRDYAEEIFRQARERGLELAIQSVKPIPSSAYPVPATRPLNSRMSSERIAQRFRIHPPSWQTGLWHVMEELIRLDAIDQQLFGTSPLQRKQAEEHAA